MTVSIEPMTVQDAPRCAYLEAVLFEGDGPWTEDLFVAELAAPHIHYVTARENGEMIGYAGVALLGQPSRGAFVVGESEVHTIGVDPAHHRRGIGGRLLDELLRIADEHGGPVFLEVRTDNEPAIELYKREGFEIVGTRAKYYQPSGVDAFTMRRPERTEGSAR
ncbi:ribosomal protein S18-alanine N-acetyltransferase [Rhodococcus sp. IEGM 1381]|uniref:ribosomal protein S18-alanine N-acetyltransferase n=1 Tax=Rhodococcus sp. IEGM 1381 TaxID=3047085 RepID=UPI0024B6A2FF|nr:ribosomal protein S18-alanine N-acetyltransferase [Rhodococcus sp. IEGM 1381]MDI9897756.1 ribosomal protein S18-alanine N-acetyltransferase [Rhodococcus sp. IEGM 1381]